MRHFALLVLLAAACSDPSDPIADDRLTTPGAAAAVTCEEVPFGAGVYAGTWDLTWYCAGYDAGDVTGLPCDPAVAAIDFTLPLTVAANSGGQYTATIGAVTFVMLQAEDDSDFLVIDPSSDDLVVLRDCGSEPHARLDYLQDLGPGSGVGWVAAAIRRQ